MSKTNNIFRQANLDRMSSPEELNDYIKVSHPGIWLILTAVVLLIVGIVVWNAFGALTTVRDAVAVVENGKATCHMPSETANVLAVGQAVRIAEEDGTVTDVAAAPSIIPADFNAYVMYVGGFKAGEFIVSFHADIDVPDGVYLAKVIVENVSPISFLLN